MRKLTALVVAATVVLAGAPAAEARPNVCGPAYHVREKVIKKHGKRAPGRNICRHGIRFKWVSKDGKRSHWGTRDARTREKRQYLRQLRKLLRPPLTRHVHTAAVPPRQAPAGTRTSAVRYNGGGGYAIPRYIVMCESAGNYRAVNGSNPNRPAGAYQIITSTWQGYGGGRYAPTADQATPAQQDEIAARIYAREGSSPWACR